MEIAKTIAAITSTPTTTSTGRDASDPKIGGLRTGLITLGAGVVASLLLVLVGVIKTQTGVDVEIDANGWGLALATLMAGVIAGLIDGLRRQAGDTAVEQKKEERE